MPSPRIARVPTGDARSILPATGYGAAMNREPSFVARRIAARTRPVGAIAAAAVDHGATVLPSSVRWVAGTRTRSVTRMVTHHERIN